MIPDTRIAVVGLGMMGGSLARALAARGARLLGYDRNPLHLDAALRDGVVQEALGHDLAGIEGAEVVLLALPVDAAVALLPILAPRVAGARLIMDVGSTKTSIVAAARDCGLGARFVGAHPLTGSHRSGWGASRAALFDDARIFLCPAPDTAPDTMRLAESFWRELHAGTEVLDAEVHDEQMAWRSHLPHLLSSTLAVTLREAAVRRSALGPGGRDMTRLAGGSPAMWAAIVEDNRAAITNALTACEAKLACLRAALQTGDLEAIHDFLRRGAEWFDGASSDDLSDPQSEQ